MKAESGGIVFAFPFPVPVMDFFVGDTFQLLRKVVSADEGPNCENFPRLTKGDLQKTGA